MARILMWVCSFAQVIWYDSVTVQGELKWQDELNELNLDFFALTDGMCALVVKHIG